MLEKSQGRRRNRKREKKVVINIDIINTIFVRIKISINMCKYIKLMYVGLWRLSNILMYWHYKINYIIID